MSAAAVDAGASTVLALDRVDRALAVGRALCGEGVDAQPWDASRGVPDGPFDTIILGHLLNELFLEARDPLVRRLELVRAALQRLTPGGRLVVIEPALRDTSRELLALRDRALADGAVAIAPCLIQAPCPALIKPSDWCHAERVWSPPAELVALAQAARIHKDRLKLSYLILAAPGMSVPHHDADRFRIVGGPLDEKGKLVRIGCGPRGRTRLVLRERDLAAHNRVFAQLERGDLVEVGALEPKGDGLRLAPDAAVERIAEVGAPVGAGS
jgi:hypothetical protein